MKTTVQQKKFHSFTQSITQTRKHIFLEDIDTFLILLRVCCSLAGKISTTTFLFLPCSVFLPAENYSLLNTIILYRSSCPVFIPLYFTLSACSKKKKLHHHLSPAQPFSYYLTLQRPLSIHYTTTPQTCRAEHGSPASASIKPRPPPCRYRSRLLRGVQILGSNDTYMLWRRAITYP